MLYIIMYILLYNHTERRRMEEVTTTAGLREDMRTLIERVRRGKTVEVRRYSETVAFIISPSRYNRLLELERRYGDENEE